MNAARGEPGGADDDQGQDVATSVPRAPFQVMPPLSAEEYAALKADVAERGVLVPVVVDQHGRTLDGHHRQAIAVELVIDCPIETVNVNDDDQAHDIAVTLNLARRHLTREQKRNLVGSEIERRPVDSDRAIARRLGCSPTTVGAVRNGRVSKLDTPTMTADEAVESAARVRDWLASVDVQILLVLLKNPDDDALRRELVTMLTTSLAISGLSADETKALFRVIVEPRIDGIYRWPDDGHFVEVARMVLSELGGAP